METTTTAATEKTKRKAAQPRRIFSAEQKTRAVLEVWTDSRKPVQVARELAITTALLDLWQKKAMKAILMALEPRQGDPGREAMLSPRIEQMIRGQARKGPVSRLVRRLGAVQAASRPAPAKSKPGSNLQPRG